MNTDYSKLKKAVESTGATFVMPNDICFKGNKPVVLTPEQREKAEADDREYHAKLAKYYRENP